MRHRRVLPVNEGNHRLLLGLNSSPIAQAPVLFATPGRFAAGRELSLTLESLSLNSVLRRTRKCHQRVNPLQVSGRRTFLVLHHGPDRKKRKKCEKAQKVQKGSEGAPFLFLASTHAADCRTDFS
jgi:hypothetical protein